MQNENYHPECINVMGKKYKKVNMIIFVSFSFSDVGEVFAVVSLKHM
jgi:hypothetical protein